MVLSDGDICLGVLAAFDGGRGGGSAAGLAAHGSVLGLYFAKLPGSNPNGRLAGGGGGCFRLSTAQAPILSLCFSKQAGVLSMCCVKPPFVRALKLQCGHFTSICTAIWAIMMQQSLSTPKCGRLQWNRMLFSLCPDQ